MYDVQHPFSYCGDISIFVLNYLLKSFFFYRICFLHTMILQIKQCVHMCSNDVLNISKVFDSKILK